MAKRKSNPAGKPIPAKNKSVRKSDVEVLTSILAYAGPVFSVHTDIVREGRHTGRRDVIRHSGSVVILAVDEGRRRRDPEVLLIRQYRHAAAQEMWELPAGRVDPGENKLAGAKRELLEETGVAALRWQHAFMFYASPGFLDETMDIYLARGLCFGSAQPEEDEQIELRMTPLSAALRMVMSNKIRDAKSMVSILWLARKLDA